ncbi:MAG: transposase [Arenicellales bacterium]
MARLPRIVVPGLPLHIIQRGNNRLPVFFVEEDYRYYLNTLTEVSLRYGCAVHAFVLMTNHVHLLMTPEADESVSRCMQALGRKYVRYINDSYGRTGTLWEGRFKSALIDSDRYFLTCYRYIELNPVRANMVAEPGDYQWSSYRSNARGHQDDLITPHEKYIELGADSKERQQTYKQLFSFYTEEDRLNIIRDATQTGAIIGNEKFKQEIARMLKRRVARFDHGGDRKGRVFHEKKISSTLTP